jgi:hypothetical protein
VTARGRQLAALALLLLGLALTPAPAAAGTHVVRIPSSVTLSITPQQAAATFKGKIKSPNQACRTNRTVRLMLRRPGKDQKVSSTPTFGQHWRLGLDNPPAGEYYARVKKRSEGTAGTIYVCKADSSPAVSYSP